MIKSTSLQPATGPTGTGIAGACSAPREGTGKSLAGPRASAEKDRVSGRQAPGLIRNTEVQIEQIRER